MNKRNKEASTAWRMASMAKINRILWYVYEKYFEK